MAIKVHGWTADEVCEILCRLTMYQLIYVTIALILLIDFPKVLLFFYQVKLGVHYTRNSGDHVQVLLFFKVHVFFWFIFTLKVFTLDNGSYFLFVVSECRLTHYLSVCLFVCLFPIVAIASLQWIVRPCYYVSLIFQEFSVTRKDVIYYPADMNPRT